MIRRRRSRMKTLKILRLFADGPAVVFLLLATLSSMLNAEPGYLDFDNLPETNFTCAGKVIGGYYADLETSCQMFHVCTIGQLDEPMDIKFLCLNGTVFDQETRVCERVDEVDCSRSERFYYLNLELYGNTMVPISEDGDEDIEDLDEYSPPIASIPSSSPKPATSSTTTSTTTTTTSTTTTTVRPTSTSARPTHKIAVKPLPPKPKPAGHQQQQHHQPHHPHSSTVKPIQYVTTFKTYEQQRQPTAGDNDEIEEYEYEDDYAVTDGKEALSYHDSSSGNRNHHGHTGDTTGGLAEQVFSPQQFIFNQNAAAAAANGASSPSPKPAISFQQQQFQNGDSLTVTNSHVTVTTHTAGDQPPGNKQFSSRPKQTAAIVAAAAAAQAALGGPSTAEQDHAIISGGAGYPASSVNSPALPVFRLPAHGFRLPSPGEAEALVAAQHKHAAELKRHQEQIDQQLKQQHDQSPQEQHLRELEQHQRRIERLQQQDLNKQLREQEHIRREQERVRVEQEREQQQQQQPFDGYQRHNPQISLRLPIEHNPNQPQFLALAQADSDFPQREHKDAKRSDPQHALSSSGVPVKRAPTLAESAAAAAQDTLYPTHAKEYRDTPTGADQRNRKPHGRNASTRDVEPKTAASHIVVQSQSTNSSADQPTANRRTPVVQSKPTSPTSTSSSSSTSTTSTVRTTVAAPARHPSGFVARQHLVHKHRHSDDNHRVLLTPQDQYIPTLPKVIITASASVSDGSGKKLNYSLGNSIGPNIKIPPLTYDEYRDDDVVLDPFYLDVPKLTAEGHSDAGDSGGRRSKRNVVGPITAGHGAQTHRRTAPVFTKKKRKK